MDSLLPDGFDTPWRRMAAAIFAPPRDAKVLGSLEVDVTESLRFVVFDHRICDGAQIGRLSAGLRHYLLHPEELDASPPETT